MFFICCSQCLSDHRGSPCESFMPFVLYVQPVIAWNVIILLLITVRLAPEEISTELTGYGHNAVTCIGMKTDIPVKMDLSES